MLLPLRLLHLLPGSSLRRKVPSLSAFLRFLMGMTVVPLFLAIMVFIGILLLATAASMTIVHRYAACGQR